ncbi:Protein phosphatase 1D [Aphelenchoides fujianensis]|nr:Protein phosphatase 1D [Aphelenchoides fujianensis]
MEDRMVIEQFLNADKEVVGLFLAVLDGHGGPEAAEHVKRILWPMIRDSEDFQSGDDSAILNTMKNSFLRIHDEMRDERAKWPSRGNGFESTAGTTCSVAYIFNQKIYTAHAGDSRITLVSGNEETLTGADLTKDHKPEDPNEKARIEEDGGAVTLWTPCARVLWKRVNTENGMERHELVPFLSIARSLGDYWSYVPETDRYAVSPMPDCEVRAIGPRDKYIILMSDGITHVMNSDVIAEHINGWRKNSALNLSHCLVKESLSRWGDIRADNMSALCVGLHADDDDVEEEEYAPSRMLELEVDANLESRLSSDPDDVLLLHPDSLFAIRPEQEAPVVELLKKTPARNPLASRIRVPTPELAEEEEVEEEKEEGEVRDDVDQTPSRRYELRSLTTMFPNNLKSEGEEEPSFRKDLKRKLPPSDEVQAKRRNVRSI